MVAISVATAALTASACVPSSEIDCTGFKSAFNRLKAIDHFEFGALRTIGSLPGAGKMHTMVTAMVYKASFEYMTTVECVQSEDDRSRIVTDSESDVPLHVHDNGLLCEQVPDVAEAFTFLDQKSACWRPRLEALEPGSLAELDLETAPLLPQARARAKEFMQ